VIDIVIGAIRHLARGKRIPSDLVERALDGATPIDELGMDSLGKIELLTEIEDRADVMLSEGMLVGLRTLDDLAHAVTKVKEQQQVHP
jgi:acyl carrier protein